MVLISLKTVNLNETFSILLGYFFKFLVKYRREFKHLFGTNARYNRGLSSTEMPNNLDAYEIG